MRLGLFLDVRNPAQWRRPWPQHYRRTLDLVVRAEELGADAVWLTEHHFFDDGYLPQPLTFAAAVATRTTRVRIGTAILLGALRHPLHIAEEAALVDVLSDGRLELGFGAGWSAAEYAAFGVDMARRFSLTDEAVRQVGLLLADGTVTPPPVQRPVPLWLGYQGPQGARRAGRLGVGLLSLRRDLLEPYREGLAEGGYDPSTARMGGVVDVIVADDPAEAADRIAPHLAHQANTYRRGRPVPPGAEPPADLTAEDLRATLQRDGRLPGLAVLSPPDAVDLLRRRSDGLPVEHLYTWLSVAGMPDDLVDRHLELLLTEVAPALR